MKIPAKELQVGDKLLSGEVKDVVHLEGPMVQFREVNDNFPVVAFGMRPAYSVVLLKLEVLRDTLVFGESHLALTIENDWMQGEDEIEVDRVER